jgi:hypothetical protein
LPPFRIACAMESVIRGEFHFKVHHMTDH